MEQTRIRKKGATDDGLIVVLTLSTLQLLRPTELRADSFASMPCWWCCSCSLWICSLIFRASWMAFITVSWSPNSAVEFRLDRISAHTEREREDLEMWFSQMWVQTVCVCWNWVELCVCAVRVCDVKALVSPHPEMSPVPGLQVGWGGHPFRGDCWGCFYCQGTGSVSGMWGIWSVLTSLAEQTGWAAVFLPPTAAEIGVWEKTDVNRWPLPSPLWGSSGFPDSTVPLCSWLIRGSLSWPTPPRWFFPLSSPLVHPSSGAVWLRCSSQLPSAFVHTN